MGREAGREREAPGERKQGVWRRRLMIDEEDVRRDP